MQRSTQQRQRGQMIVLFALASTAMILVAGLVIDGGYALAQRRSSQNTADLAALAGARVLASLVSGDAANGTDANVVTSIDRTLAVNGALPMAYGAPNGPRYVAMDGTLLAYVGTGSIPGSAVGVQVGTSRTWRPFFLGLIGVNTWSAGATATARGGYRAGGRRRESPPDRSLQGTYETSSVCPAGTPPGSCSVVDLTEESGNTGGGHLRIAGWLWLALIRMRERHRSERQLVRARAEQQWLRQQQALPRGRVRAIFPPIPQ